MVCSFCSFLSSLFISFHINQLDRMFQMDLHLWRSWLRCGVPCLGLIENHLTIFSDFSFLAAPDNRTPPLTATSYICGCSNFEWGAGQTIIAGQPPLKGYFQPARLAPESSSTAKQLLDFLTFWLSRPTVCIWRACKRLYSKPVFFALFCKSLENSGSAG